MKSPERVSIRALIETRKVFVVPKYQRTYAWEDDEIDDFIKDITNLMRIRVDNKPPMQHFLGGFVSIEEDETNANPAHKYQVVDGQQRLSTFILALSLLARAFNQIKNDVNDSDEELKAKNFAESIQQFLHYGRLDNHTGIKTTPPTLKLSKTDCDFFESLIKGEYQYDEKKPPQIASHKRLLYSYQQISKRLIDNILSDSNLSSDGKINHLIKLQQALLDDCYVIHIISENVSEGYRLFAILNDRGQRLSDADLLRSHTLSLLEGNPLQSEVEMYWDHFTEGTFEEVDGFLRSYYVSYEGTRVSRGGLFDSYVEKYFNYRMGTTINDADEAQKMTDRVKNLSEEWDIYRKISNGTWPYERSVVNAWQRNRLYLLIKILGHDLCIPLLMSAYQKYSESEFVKLVSILERFYFRYKIIVNEHMGTVGNIYYGYSKGIRDDSKQSTLSNLKSELQDKITAKANDDIFKLQLVAELAYQDRPARKNGIKYFLTTLDDYLKWYENGANGEPSPNTLSNFDLTQITIDHIYPQHPQEPNKTLDDIQHLLGNLTLLSGADNSSAGNKYPPDKKTAYQNENKISLTQKLANQVDSWDGDKPTIETQIKNRQNSLIKMALEIFKL